MELKVGQELVYVPSDSRRPIQRVTIEKIGRKWATLSKHYGRIDLATLQVDGGDYSSPGRCWVSEEAHTQFVAATKEWREFCQLIWGYSPPASLTADKIREARKILGL